MLTGQALVISTVHSITNDLCRLMMNRMLPDEAEAVVCREEAGAPLREMWHQVGTSRVILLTLAAAGVVAQHQHQQTVQNQTEAGAARLLVWAGLELTLEVGLADSEAGAHRRTPQVTRQK